MFIRKKGGSYYMVENRRDGGKVKQSIVAHLGTSDKLDDAIVREMHSIESNERWRGCLDDKIKPSQWRRACANLTRKQHLDFDSYCWSVSPEERKKAGTGFYKQWQEWRKAKVDDHLKAKHAKKLACRDKSISASKENLSKAMGFSARG
jgi:hypothetical protein